MIFNFAAQTIPTIPCRHYVLCKAASKTKHSDILLPVSKFVVVVILSEWWLVLTTVSTSLDIVLY